MGTYKSRSWSDAHRLKAYRQILLSEQKRGNIKNLLAGRLQDICKKELEEL
jgi:hypothetical protein